MSWNYSWYNITKKWMAYKGIYHEKFRIKKRNYCKSGKTVGT